MTEKELETEIARVICLASGCEPDLQVPLKATNLMLPKSVGGALTIVPPEYLRPAWSYFLPQARAVIQRMRELDETR